MMGGLKNVTNTWFSTKSHTFYFFLFKDRLKLCINFNSCENKQKKEDDRKYLFSPKIIKRVNVSR